MPALSSLQRVFVLSAAGLSLCSTAPAFAQTLAASAATASDDMAMPDDLGKPLEGMIPVRRVVSASGLMTLDTPVGDIAADPRGKAVLEKDLPGLCERPEYVMFKSMTLKQLQGMSHGQMSQSDLDQVQSDLSAQQIAVAAQRRTHNPILVSRRVMGRMTHALYQRVVLVVASL